MRMMEEGRKDPAILAIESQIEETKDVVDKARQRRDKADAEIKEGNDRLIQLRELLRNAVRLMVAPTAEAAQTGRKPVRRSEAEWKVLFRDWVVDRGTEPFIQADVQEGLNIGNNSTRAKSVIQNALKSGLIAHRGTKASKRGREINVYAYIDPQDAKLDGPVPGKDQHVAGNGGGGPIAGRTRHPNKDVQDAITPALNRGASLERRGNDHFQLKMEGKRPVILSSSPSDRNAVKRIRADMRRNGYPVT